MSGIATSVSSYDIGIQALYNRVLVQIGLAAFRIGLISEAHSYLNEICNSQKVRELLSQGVSKISPGDKEERRRLLPFHLHINLEVIESVFYLSGMLLEIPNLASESSDPSKSLSKLFKRLLENYDKSVMEKFHFYELS
jgi:translation initiation factor 3 subunit C